MTNVFTSRSVGRAIALVFLTGGVMAGLAWWGTASRARAMSTLTDETRERAVPAVAVMQPTPGAPLEEVVLPGNVQAYVEAPIFARTNGYVRRRAVELGERVRTGQLLAEIDAPELEQQLQQARADVTTAQANLRLAQITADRYRDLRTTDSVSQQDADNAAGALEARTSVLQSAQHNVQRLEQLQGFTRIVAPFSGVITARNTDVGALVDPGAGGGTARELFHLAATDKMRVAVDVPEAYAQAATPGLRVELSLAQFPGRRFVGILARTAQAIDVASRTLPVEIEVGNRSGELLPGAYAEVHFALPRVVGTYVVPVSALMAGSKGLRVALVRDGSRIAITAVTPGRDFGTEMEIVAGLTRTDAVVVNPPGSLVDGQIVRVVQPGATAGQRGAR